MRGCDSGGELMWSARSVGEKKGQKALQVQCKNQVIVQVQLGQDSGGRRRRRSGRTIILKSQQRTTALLKRRPRKVRPLPGMRLDWACGPPEHQATASNFAHSSQPPPFPAKSMTIGDVVDAGQLDK